MSKYQAYPEYKDSGIEWANQIPQHWNFASLSKLFEIKAGGDLKVNYFSEEKDKDHPFPIYTNANDEKAVYGYTSKPFFKGNSITVSGRGEVGYAVYRDHPFDAIIRLLVLSPTKKLNLKFFTYFIKDVIDFQVESSAIGQLSTSQISPFKVVFPAVEEQTQIAAFLDHETAKIDTLIEKQQQLIELLKEKRQAVISHAVTKGLNPDAPMKDSGVEWLGQVPEHWEAINFGITNESATLGGNYQSGEGENGLPLIKMGNLARGNIQLNKIERLNVGNTFDNDHLLKHGDFLFNTRNSLDLVGKVSIWKNELPKALYNSNILRVTFKPKLVQSTQYMSYLFNSDLGLSQLRLLAKGTTSVAAIYYKELKSLICPLPPLKEQSEIVQYLDSYLLKNKKLIQKSMSAISLMQERRTALISAAVTGKIDVRNWVAPATSSDTNEAQQEVTA
ncbi:restriction endonuclease subunit S [Photobacterium damselae subsp. damselae]|uniref:restriction endonuclease subunit S n=1 Tax=Photobacterium damselae TaxID=38293 RepID=UPI001EEEB483|nr:restriction endonuclease subunit S [Photobacterium damselae]UJZ93398.1 restriction endonuclease subunit S [Photobacterium damselae subsp. damselae]UJZ97380.1 restriction endonuclease subunit S [Photobacterium damselae subsp. damselae]